MEKRLFQILLVAAVIGVGGCLWWLMSPDSQDNLTTPESTPDNAASASQPDPSASPDRPANRPPSSQAKARPKGIRIIAAVDIEKEDGSELSYDELKDIVNSGDDGKILSALEILHSREYSPENFALISRAYESKAHQVRAEAVTTAAEMGGPDLPDFLSRAVTDESHFVGLTTLEEAENFSPQVRKQVFTAALQRAPYETGAAVIADLEVDSSKKSLTTMFEALDSQIPEVREEANDIFDLDFDQTFESKAEALQWWEANKDRYDADLVEK